MERLLDNPISPDILLDCVNTFAFTQEIYFIFKLLGASENILEGTLLNVIMIMLQIIKNISEGGIDFEEAQMGYTAFQMWSKTR